MAERVLVDEPALGESTRGAWWVRTPWWTRVLAVFVASRIVSTIILLIFAAMQGRSFFGPADPDYFGWATIWDGQWYQFIASIHAYPSVLPRDSSGAVAENAWAFLPAYPYLVAGLTQLVGLPFKVLAPIVSTLFAAGTALLLYRMLCRRLPGGGALFSVAVFCFAPLSPILQVDYAESMELFLIALLIVLVVRRRYLWAIPTLLVLDFTKSIGFAVSLFLLIHLVQRWRMRRSEPFPPAQAASLVVAGAASAVGAVAWTLIAWAVTGVPNAYTATELAWRSGYTDATGLVPFASWFEGADFWLRYIGVAEPAAVIAGAALILILIAVTALILRTPRVRRLGSEARIWVISYGVYLLAVFFPQSSTFRLLMPMFPLVGAVAVPKSRIYRVTLLVVCVVLQVGWVYIDWWVIGKGDWTPP